MLEIEQICREAISKLRANNGCDITFKSISEGHTPWDDPLNISILYMHADFNGKYFEFAMQSKIFTDTEPTSIEDKHSPVSEVRYAGTVQHPDLADHRGVLA